MVDDVLSVLLPAINCMRDLVKYHRGKWKYYINLTGQEFPLRSNLEFVRIAKIFNGSSDIAIGSMERYVRTGIYRRTQARTHVRSPAHILSNEKNYNWHELPEPRVCRARGPRHLCIRDVPWLGGRPELFANKFHLTYQYLALDCLEERHRNRTMAAPSLDEDFYRRLPTVLYSRKDGLR